MRAVEIRGTARDWQQLRAIRLAALADSPDAFSGTLAEAGALPDAEWRRRATPSASSVCFVAVAAGVWIGMCAVLLRGGRADLVAVWVHPAHRRRGVVTGLVGAAIEWAAHQGHSELLVGVNAANPAAIAAYEKLGFVRTGASKPFPNRPELTETFMKVSLSHPS